MDLRTGDKKNCIVHEISAGSSFGELALVQECVRTATIISNGNEWLVAYGEHNNCTNQLHTCATTVFRAEFRKAMEGLENEDFLPRSLIFGFDFSCFHFVKFTKNCVN